MKRILVPTDFSNFAENALQVAASIAKKIIVKYFAAFIRIAASNE
jgi:hypothetical protein